MSDEETYNVTDDFESDGEPVEDDQLLRLVVDSKEAIQINSALGYSITPILDNLLELAFVPQTQIDRERTRIYKSKTLEIILMTSPFKHLDLKIISRALRVHYDEVVDIMAIDDSTMKTERTRDLIERITALNLNDSQLAAQVLTANPITLEELGNLNFVDVNDLDDLIADLIRNAQEHIHIAKATGKSITTLLNEILGVAGVPEDEWAAKRTKIYKSETLRFVLLNNPYEILDMDAINGAICQDYRRALTIAQIQDQRTKRAKITELLSEYTELDEIQIEQAANKLMGDKNSILQHLIRVASAMEMASFQEMRNLAIDTSKCKRPLISIQDHLHIKPVREAYDELKKMGPQAFVLPPRTVPEGPLYRVPILRLDDPPGYDDYVTPGMRRTMKELRDVRSYQYSRPPINPNLDAEIK